MAQGGRWGKHGTRDEKTFLGGPGWRLEELRRLLRILLEFLRGFRVLHFVGPCVTVFGSARFVDGHPWYELAQESGANVEAVEGWAQAVSLLQQGRVDATINDELTFLDYVNTTPDAAIEVAAETDDPSLSALAFTKDKQALVDAVNGALAELREEGVLAELGEKYFGADVSEFVHAATIAVVGEVPLERLWHATPCFPTRSEIWLRLLEAYGL